MYILIALDQSDCSEKAIEWVLSRHWSKEDKFMVVSVADLSLSDYDRVFESNQPVVDDIEKSIRTRTRELVQRQVEQLKKSFPDNHVTSHIEEGDPTDSIVNLADTWGAELIVMGSHGRRGFQRLLLGSVAASVLAKATCSVLVVKGAEKKQEQTPCATNISASKVG